MIFPDDESRKDFSETSHMVQIVAYFLEFECAKYSHQIEFIRAEHDIAYVALPTFDIPGATIVCEKVNSLFKRKDKQATVVIVDRKNMFVKILAETKDDFLEVI